MYFLCFCKIRKDEQGIAAHKSAKKGQTQTKSTVYWGALRLHLSSQGAWEDQLGTNQLLDGWRKVVPRETWREQV